ncbi:hypothetical protein C8F01DRAFT_36426 [Mycena amicta]|nr:hypothetical protein C8F01DRAFT_36426 [Mycena amicta]
MWFNNRRDEGATYPELFGPVLPRPTMALILTIECCIDEWLSGVRTDVAFTTTDYASVYRNHIESMAAFEAGTAPRPILESILKRIHTIGRLHSGAAPLAPAQSATSLSLAAITAANAEWDDGDTESDNDSE